MCKICAEWQLGKLTKQEALRNAYEAIDPESNTEEELRHYWNLAESLSDEDEDTEC